MKETESRPARKPMAHRGKVLTGYLLAFVCLAWVFHDVEYRDLFRNLGTTAWWLIGLAIVGDILSYARAGAGACYSARRGISRRCERLRRFRPACSSTRSSRCAWAKCCESTLMRVRLWNSQSPKSAASGRAIA